MINTLPAASQTRRVYDHRIREQVLRRASGVCPGTSPSRDPPLVPGVGAVCALSSPSSRSTRTGSSCSTPSRSLIGERESSRPLSDPSGTTPRFWLQPGWWPAASRRQRQGRYPTRHHQRKPIPPSRHDLADRAPRARAIPRMEARLQGSLRSGRPFLLPAYQPEPASARRSRQHQGHGARAGIPAHACEHPGGVCPAHWQGLRLAQHLGQTHP